MKQTTRDALADVARRSSTAADFSFAYRNFLDDFYRHPTSSALAGEPGLLSDRFQDSGYADAFLAAMAEHLASQHGWPVPGWARNPQRSLQEPTFAFKTPEGRMFLIVESPAAFRTRNIFISADALSRA